MTTGALASIAFLKIQGFAHRPVVEQTRLRAQLEAVLAVSAADLEPASRIVLDGGDGMALVVLCDPQAALRVAGRALGAQAAGLSLSVGLNYGPIRVLGNASPPAMMGDGVAVAANIAEFAPAAQLRASQSFRDALAEAAPGREACLVCAGVSTDSSLRRHDLYRCDQRAPARRVARYAMLSVALAAALVTAGVGTRVAEVGHEAFVSGVVAAYRDTAAHSELYLRGLAQKVGFP